MQGLGEKEQTADIKDKTVCRNVKDKIHTAGLWRVPGTEQDSERTHFLSPEPFPLSHKQIDILHRLGPALLAFYNAVNDLYLRSGNEWVNQYLDTGKSDDMLRLASMKFQKKAIPRILRPDILVTHEGFVITELDSVPGGFGHLDCLSAAYADEGFDILGGARGMRDGFASMIRSASSNDDPVCAIIVSDESIDYLQEMMYLAGALRETGLRAYTVRPKEVIFTEDGLLINVEDEQLKVDVVYRFFELFDLLNIPKSELISYAARKKIAVVTPPYKPYLEEKILLALLHHRALKDYWLKSLGEENYQLLMDLISPTWIMDNRPVPPHAEIAGFQWQGRPIRDWREIGQGTQKERRFVLKPSGYSPLAWGSRGVKIGHDMPEDEWANAVENALSSFESSPYVLQPFQDTSVFGIKYYNEASNELREVGARVRLCPYYFVTGNNAALGGVLSTAVPKDKKIVHGMVDAIITPCCEKKES